MSRSMETRRLDGQLDGQLQPDFDWQPGRRPPSTTGRIPNGVHSRSRGRRCRRRRIEQHPGSLTPDGGGATSAATPRPGLARPTRAPEGQTHAAAAADRCRPAHPVLDDPCCAGPPTPAGSSEGPRNRPARVSDIGETVNDTVRLRPTETLLAVDVDNWMDNSGRNGRGDGRRARPVASRRVHSPSRPRRCRRGRIGQHPGSFTPAVAASQEAQRHQDRVVRVGAVRGLRRAERPLRRPRYSTPLTCLRRRDARVQLRHGSGVLRHERRAEVRVVIGRYSCGQAGPPSMRGRARDRSDLGPERPAGWSGRPT